MPNDLLKKTRFCMDCGTPAGWTSSYMDENGRGPFCRACFSKLPGEDDEEETGGCARCLVDLAGRGEVICGLDLCESCSVALRRWAGTLAPPAPEPAPAADKYNFPSWFFGGLAFGPVPGDTRYIYANGRVFSFSTGKPVSASAVWREPLIGVKCHHCRGIFGTSFHLEDGVVSCSRCARDNTGEPLRVGDFSEKWAAAAGVKDKATVSLEAISKLYQDPWKDDPRYGLHEASSLPQATSEMHGNGVIWNKQRSGLDKRSYKHPRTKREVPMPLDLDPPGGW